MPDPSHEDQFDFELMARVKLGDETAFRTLVERHQHRVAGTVARMLGGDRDAEDIAQQVFIRVWRSAPRYQPTAKFTTWLLTITRNLVFNETRRRSRATLVSLDAEDSDDHPARQFIDPSVQPASQEVLDSELAHAIDEAIRSLPEQQRLAVILRRYEELPYEDIARILDTTVPAIKSLLFRARTDLKTTLAKYL